MSARRKTTYKLNVVTQFTIHAGDGRGFINVSSRMATGFHRQAKLFELNFFIRKTLLEIL